MPLYPVRQETREMDARSPAQAIPRPATVRQLTIVWSARHTNPARPSTSSKFRGPASRNPGNVRHGPGPHRGLYETCWVRLEMGRSWDYVDIQQTGDVWGIRTPHNSLLYTVYSRKWKTLDMLHFTHSCLKCLFKFSIAPASKRSSPRLLRRYFSAPSSPSG